MSLRLGALDELNAMPLWFALAEDPAFTIVRGSRGAVSRMLEDGQVDLAVVAVVSAAEHGWHRVPGCGIATAGALGSVLLLSNRSTEEARTVFVSEDSRSSSLLLAALLRREGRTPRIVPLPAARARAAALGDPETAVLLIGDEALRARADFAFVVDLPERWVALTSRPMVFAVWAGASPIPPSIVQRLAAAIDHADTSQIAREVARAGWIDEASALRYLAKLHHRLDEADEQGMALFLSILRDERLIECDDRWEMPALDPSLRKAWLAR